MKTFIACFKNELKKVTARKKFLVFLIIEVLICLGTAAANSLISTASKGAISQSLMLSNMPMNMLGFFTQIYIPLLILMTSCDLFSGEAHDGTIRASFMRPVSRFKLYSAKIAAVVTTAAAYLGVLFLLTTGIKMIGAHSAAGIGVQLGSYLLDIVPMLVLTLFIAMFNQFSNSPSLSMILCIVLYIGLYIAGILMPQFSGLMFTGYFQWHNLWMGVTLPFRALAAKMGILLGYSMIFGCIGYYLFERKEA